MSAEKKFFAAAGGLLFAALVVTSANIAFDSHFFAGFAKNFIANPLWQAVFQIFPALWAGIYLTKRFKKRRHQWIAGLGGSICILLLTGFLISIFLDVGSPSRQAQIKADKSCNQSAKTAACREALETQYEGKSYTCKTANKGRETVYTCAIDGKTPATPDICIFDDETKSCARAYAIMLYRIEGAQKARRLKD